MSRRLGKLLAKLGRHGWRWSGLEHRAVDRRKRLDRIGAVDKQNQVLLMLHYQDRVLQGLPLPALADVEFRSFSQNGEDGLLLYVFALVGWTSRRSVEIGAADGIECNSANLIVNHGFRSLLFETRERKVALGRRFYAESKEAVFNQPVFVNTWVERDTIDAVVREHGFDGEIDLLSIDIDGVDWWIWEALTCVRPRVVIVEYNGTWSADHAVTVPYARNFVRKGHYVGASLAAFVSLGRRKGYRLVGCQRGMFNAILVRDDLGQEVLPEVPASSCLGRHRPTVEEQEARLAREAWVRVREDGTAAG